MTNRSRPVYTPETPEEIVRQEAKNRNRIPNYRWKVGEDPHDDDAHPDSPWFFVKQEVVEHGDDPNQRHLLKSGPETGLPCHICGQMTHAAAERMPIDILRTTGYSPPEGAKAPEDPIVICACPQGHLQQFRASMLPSRRKK